MNQAWLRQSSASVAAAACHAIAHAKAGVGCKENTQENARDTRATTVSALQLFVQTDLYGRTR
jgi:mevalonate pyrophosphate decarboxylase